MDDGGNFTPNSSFGAFPDTAIDLDFMDELLYEGCWLEATDAFDFLQPGPSSSGAVNDPPTQYLPYSGCTTDHLSINLNTNQPVYPEGTERKFFENPSPVYPKIEELNETHPGNHQGLPTTSASGQSVSFLVEESGKRLWIAPRANSGPSSTVTDRLMQAILHMKDHVKDGNVLVQIWVPVKRGGKQVLTTDDQPYFHDPNSKSLLSYRNVSKAYHFAADEDSKELAGLPGRVYLGRLPEWTPDVRFFRSDEYPRVDFAQQFDVHGSIALPVFERSSGACLGVVEVITTRQKANYRPDLENVCKALEAVDLRSENFSNLCVKPINETHHAALPVIAEVLRYICKTHSLPLALTWVPCCQEDVGGQSDGINAHCFLTADSAYFVTDQSLLDFVDACSEHQLFQGQGIVGKAVTSGKQCFAADITAFIKSVYPLSHHARMFGLRGAVAIPLRGVNTGRAEFVLELFLPNRCQDTEEQRRMLNSLSIVIQQCCQRLHLVMDKELEEIILPVREGHTSNASSPSKEASPEQSSWIAQIMESQQKGKGVSVSWDYEKEEPKEEFKVTTHWDDAQMESYHKQVFPEFGQFEQNSRPKSSVEGDGDTSSLSVRRLVGSRKPGEKRRTKAEKTISLQVLRQYFAGSLKDAAKSIGGREILYFNGKSHIFVSLLVPLNIRCLRPILTQSLILLCPTTLKRICRQHGITRWPSRKIKKVGHSLRKLQLVIDSVQGSEGAIQIGSFYTSFPELSSPNISGSGPFSSMKTGDHSKPLNPQQPDNNGLISIGATASKSPSSSCSQSSGSSTCCSTGAMQNTATINTLSSGDALMVENSGGMLKRTLSDAGLHALNQEQPKLLARSQSHKALGEHPSLESLPPLPKHRLSGTFRVKATFGEEKIRFSLQPNWGFLDVQQEIAKRFNIDDVSRFDLKYLDDDHEWVLLTCEADLEECIDIYKSSQSHTIKISIHAASKQKFGKLVHSTAPS
ncbi:hypothetical protein Ddye_004301 [Dipteronia dyeriana]|uniref:Protein NLP2-like n=1 Tax=Dipteronia dyeriana TaxID=168575 RepID=A0AAE0CW40_9ROSI|nr:hypothetical protein Ddye_004301 [Dipteronia dyeriana]